MYLFLIQIHGRDGKTMDTKFSAAVHILILLSESPEPINSDQMAKSVGTNASYIRKVLALMKHAGIVHGRQGISGYTLLVAPAQLTLLQIYQAVMEEHSPHLLDVHQNPSDRCIVGRHIRPVLNGMFAEAEEAFSRALAEKTLADCIASIQAALEPSE